MGNLNQPNYKNKNVGTKHSHNNQKNRRKRIAFRTRKWFYKIKRWRIKDQKRNIRIEELFFTTVILSIDDMERTEQKEMKKKDLLGTIGQ